MQTDWRKVSVRLPMFHRQRGKLCKARMLSRALLTLQKLDGLEAVNKLNSGAKYDLVLMDIIMPNLDGVSATHLVRQFDNQTPIIAMTSNIRSDDISMYFQHGKLKWLF